jgi:uncharacterized phage infection (PIP) family protein YhgE
MNKSLEKSSEALKKVKDAAKNAAQVVVENLENSLRKAESALEDVRGKFNNFKNAIGNTISGILNFGKAAESENFLKGLTEQATQATLFADKVRQLVVLGLNERAIRQVLDAGFEAGSKIADEIISGGQTVVQQVNTLVDSIFGVAEQVGEFGAVAFYDAGVKQAEAMVAGIKAAGGCAAVAAYRRGRHAHRDDALARTHDAVAQAGGRDAGAVRAQGADDPVYQPPRLFVLDALHRLRAHRGMLALQHCADLPPHR